MLGLLTNLPLAITQAAAYMNMLDISVEEYLILSRQEMMDLMRNRHEDDNFHDESQYAVATTWLISFKQLEKQSSAATRLLRFMIWIQPQAIPMSILPDVGSEGNLIKAIGLLKSYGFVRARPERGMFDIHSLVHMVMRSWTVEQGIDDEIKTDAINHLSGIFQSDDWDVRETWRAQLPHILHILNNFRETDPSTVLELGYWAGRCLYKDGQIKEAVALLEHVVKIEETTLAEDHPSRLSSQHVLAGAYKSNGQIKEAVTLLEHIVKIQETTLAEDHPDRLSSQHELAGAYESNGQIIEAVALLEHVVQIRETTLAEDHPSRLASQHVLARAYESNSQIKEAVALLEHVVKIQETTLAEDHPSRLASQHELARAYESNGQIKEAVTLLEHIVKIQEITLAEDHPNGIRSETHLSDVLDQVYA
ncbi:hypothetical protein VHEMI02809 [[Torrubiella] hemipterigena]|uniref:Uncharacterized protein n=1 Tax=[Torrubiella] hemipterigena TaxID=1531966 RepID=A0A0A1SWU1_9HYPO|nr:hypothetical protein VHEMI02809 [[Torrubiella] hemipterigena]